MGSLSQPTSAPRPVTAALGERGVDEVLRARDLLVARQRAVPGSAPGIGSEGSRLASANYDLEVAPSDIRDRRVGISRTRPVASCLPRTG
jgi:hypothetical protein